MYIFGLVLTVAVIVMGMGMTLVSGVDDPTLGSLQTVLDQQASTISQLQATVTSLTSRLDGCCSQKPVVAFHARLQHLQNVATLHTIVFDHAELNLGNAYSPSTGHFVTPLPGLYMFDLKVTNASPGNLHCHIYKNELPVAEVEASGDDYNGLDRASTWLLVQLEKGDVVRAVRTDGSTTTVYPYLTSSFSGALIQPM